MTEQAIKARREYKRKWAQDNPDKVKAQQARYWEKRAAAQTRTDHAQQQDTPAAKA